MTEITISIDDKLAKFITEKSQGDNVNYICKIIEKYYQWSMKNELICALKEDVSNPDYIEEYQLWDTLAGEGID